MGYIDCYGCFIYDFVMCGWCCSMSMFLADVKCYFFLAISSDIIGAYLSHLWWCGWVVKGVLQ